MSKLNPSNHTSKPNPKSNCLYYHLFKDPLLLSSLTSINLITLCLSLVVFVSSGEFTKEQVQNEDRSMFDGIRVWAALIPMLCYVQEATEAKQFSKNIITIQRKQNESGQSTTKRFTFHSIDIFTVTEHESQLQNQTYIRETKP